jgi:DNA polymerase-4
VAKIATDVGKNTNKTMDYPMAIQNVLPGNEASFLAPLPTKMLWGIGKQTAKILDDLGIHTIGDLANWPESDLIQRFGQHGKGLHRRALGIDQREIRPHSDTKSFSQEVTFSKDINDEKIIREQITRQSGSITMSLHAGGLFGKVVKIKIRWPNFTTISKQVTLPTPTDDDKVIAEAAMKLLDQNWKHNHPIRLIGVSVSGLCPPSKQLSFWDQVREKGKKRPDGLEAAIQKVKMRFGESSIYFGNEQKGSKLREK